MRRLIFLPLVLLTGCATATNIGLPDGSEGYALNCSGTANGWGACWKKAGEVCQGRGYEILARDETTGQMTILNANNYGLYGSSSPTISRELIVKCK